MSRISPKVHPSVLLRQAPGPRIRKRGSVAGPGIKIRAKVARIRVPSPYPAKDGRIWTPVFSLSLIFLKRFREVLTGDPNEPFGGLGPPIPPSTRVKT